MQLADLLAGAASTAARIPLLALVPLVTGLSRWTDVMRTAARPGTRVSVHFGFPHPPADLWTFADASSEGVRVDPIGGPTVVDAGLLVDLVAIAVVSLLVRGLLVAGYLGSIDQFLEEDRYEFLENVRRYAVPILGYEAVVLATILALAGTGFVDPSLLLVVLPVALALAYVFYLTPYLIVVEGRGTLEAFRRSATLTVDRIPAAVFFVTYAILVAVASVPLSLLLNGGIDGVLLAAVLASALGHVLTTFAVLFTRALVGLEPAPAAEGTAVDGGAAS